MHWMLHVSESQVIQVSSKVINKALIALVTIILNVAEGFFNFTGHTVKRVMWFRVSAEGRREFTHHTDPNQISLSYRGRTR